MRTDYQPYFDRLKTLMDHFGYISMLEGELSAEFLFSNGWKLRFVGEKYYGPLFGLDLIAPPNSGIKRGQRFSPEDGIEIISYDLDTLIIVFERLKGILYKDLSESAIESSMDFLSRERKIVFNYPHIYEEEFSFLSSLPLTEINDIIASHRAGIVTPPATKFAQPFSE